MKISETEVKKFRKHDAVTTSSKPTVWQGLQSPPDQSGLDSQLLHYVTLKPAKTVYMAQVSIVVDWQETQTSMLHCDRASQLVTNEVHPTKSPLTFGCTSHGLLHRTAPAVFIFPISGLQFTTEWDKKPLAECLSSYSPCSGDRGEGAELWRGGATH